LVDEIRDSKFSSMGKSLYWITELEASGEL